MRPFAKAAISANTILLGGGGEGPDLWYYTSDYDVAGGGTVISTGWQPQNFAYGGEIVVAQSGTLTSLSMWGSVNTVAVGCKFALYDDAGNLVANATGSNTTTGSGSWIDLSVNVPISSGTYHIYASSETEFGWWYHKATAAGFGIAIGYASFPSSTEGTPGGENSFGGRIFVD